MRRLGSYTLTRRLGVGGMGEVWKGRHEALGGAARQVAIKVLSAERSRDADARAMFLDEARLSMLLHSSNIVQVYDVAEDEHRTCYMVMEWVNGLDLAELSERLQALGERLSDTIIAYVIGEVLKGLAHAHEIEHEGEKKTIVHRDISPHNVMISRSGEVKIMDFGIARISSENTSGGLVKGKLRYMPPEQLGGDTRAPTVDLFAVGAMLQELLDNNKFRGDAVDEGHLIGMVVGGEIPELTRAPASIPAPLEELRRSLLAARPEDRVQSARAAFRRLCSWPGYRDARFELEELVVEVSSADEAKLEDTTHTGASPQPEAQPEAQPEVAHPARVTPAASAELALGARADAEPPTRGLEGSHTDVARRSTDTGTSIARARDRAQGNRKLMLLALGFSAFALLPIAAIVIFGLGGDEAPVAATEDDAPAGDDTGGLDPAPAEDDTDELDTSTGGDALDEADELGTSTGGGTPDEADAPAGDAGASTEGDELILEDEPSPEAEVETELDDDPEPRPPSRVPVRLSLAKGVPWAELRIAGHRLTLDALEHGSASRRLKPGTYRCSYRLQFEGAWKSAGRVTIPEGGATLELARTGVSVVD